MMAPGLWTAKVAECAAALQDRLVRAMRLEGIDSIEEANAFPPRHMARQDERLACPLRKRIDVHRQLAPHEHVESR